MNPVYGSGAVSFEYEDMTYSLFPEKTDDGVTVLMYADYPYDDHYTRELIGTIKPVDGIDVECLNKTYRFSSSVSSKSMESYKYAFYKQLRKLSSSVAEMRPSLTLEQMKQMNDDKIWATVDKSSIVSLMEFIDGNPLSSYRNDAQKAIYRHLRTNYLSFVPVKNENMKDVYLGKSEITNELWNIFMGGKEDNDSPVVNVSFQDITCFIEKLNNYSTHRFRLPTAEEWEYAAKNKNKFHIEIDGIDNGIFEFCSDNYCSVDGEVRAEHTVRDKEFKKYPLNGKILTAFSFEDTASDMISFRIAINANELN